MDGDIEQASAWDRAADRNCSQFVDGVRRRVVILKGDNLVAAIRGRHHSLCRDGVAIQPRSWFDTAISISVLHPIMNLDRYSCAFLGYERIGDIDGHVHWRTRCAGHKHVVVELAWVAGLQAVDVRCQFNVIEQAEWASQWAERGVGEVTWWHNGDRVIVIVGHVVREPIGMVVSCNHIDQWIRIAGKDCASDIEGTKCARGKLVTSGRGIIAQVTKHCIREAIQYQIR